MTPPCVVPTFRPYTVENLEFGGFYASSCESRASVAAKQSRATGTQRSYGAGGEEMATSSLHLTMECRDAPAERLEQVPRRPGPK